MEKSNWYIGTLHFLTAGILVPLVVSFIASSILLLVLEQDTVLMQLLSFVIWNLGLWLGIMYSARFIRKKFNNYSPSRVALEGVLYSGLLALLLLGYGVYVAFTIPGAEFNYLGAGMFVVSAGVSTALFYYISLHYLVDDVF